MSKLREIQLNFQSYLQFEEKSPFIESIVNSMPMTAERRIHVYFEGYRLRLYEAMQIDYPKVEILLGQCEFYEAVVAYIAAYPSKYFSVRYFGQSFDTFLKENEPYKHYPIMAEMANFEWALMESLDAPDAKTASLDDLRKFRPEQWGYLVFNFHPSVHTRTYEWDTPALWKDIEEEKPKREPRLLESPQAWIFWHRALRSKYESMSDIQLKLYECIHHKMSFAQMAETFCEFMPEDQVPVTLLQHLQYWIEQGLIMDITLSDEV